MHRVNQPKPYDWASPRLRRLSLALLAMYLGVLGMLLVHSVQDEHCPSVVEHCCLPNPDTQEIHYHDAEDSCSLPTHSLLPSPLVHIPRVDSPRVTQLISPYQRLSEAEVVRSICFYQLRAPPLA